MKIFLSFLIFFSFQVYSFEEVADNLKNIIARDRIKLVETKSESARNTLGFYFISDNQFNNFLGDPQLLRNKVADKVVVVAIRPPRLDLFAPDMLEHTIRMQGKDKFAIHLGDATNIACQNEWKKFVQRMKPTQMGERVSKGWVMVPGNHDFYFLGNTAGHHWMKRGGMKKIWAQACNDRSYPAKVPKNLRENIIVKDDFVRLYLKELIKQSTIPEIGKNFPFNTRDGKCKKSKVPTKLGLTEPSTRFESCEWKSKNPKSFLQRVHYKLPLKKDVRVAYRALLVQEVNLNPPGSRPFHYKGVLLDTQDYFINPSIASSTIFGKIAKYFGKVNPGENGAIQKRQGDIVKAWIKENNKVHKKENTVYVFMGHHPYELLLYLSKARLNGIFSGVRYHMYVSSHTHFGWIKKHKAISELNVGSVTDWGTLGSQTVYLQKAKIKSSKGEGGDSPGYWKINQLKKQPAYLQKAKIKSSKNERGDPPDIKIPVYWKTNQIKNQPAYMQKFCKPEWNATNDKDEKHGYLAYKNAGWLPSAAHDKTLDILIEAYRDMYLRLDRKQFSKQTAGFIADDLFRLKQNEVALKKACGAYKAECRNKKFEMLKNLYTKDKINYRSDPKYNKTRRQYGVCQAIWSSIKENETWGKGPIDPNPKWMC